MLSLTGVWGAVLLGMAGSHRDTANGILTDNNWGFAEMALSAWCSAVCSPSGWMGGTNRHK